MSEKKSRCVCAVPNCLVKGYNSNKKFYRFPRNPNRARIWAIKANREDLLERLTSLHNSYRLCETHFEEKMFTGPFHIRLLANAVPTLFPSPEVISSTSDHSYSAPPLLSPKVLDDRELIPADTEIDSGIYAIQIVTVDPELRPLVHIESNLPPITSPPLISSTPIKTEEEDASFYHSNQPTLYNLAETEVKDEIDDEIEIKYQPMTVSLDQIKEEIDIDDYNSPSVTHQLKKRKTSYQPAYEVIEQTSRTESDTQIHNPMEDVQIDEWNHFGNNIACQLRNLPLERALSCQQKIIEILTQERIDFVMKMKTEDTNTTTED